MGKGGWVFTAYVLLQVVGTLGAVSVALPVSLRVLGGDGEGDFVGFGGWRYIVKERRWSVEASFAGAARLLAARQSARKV